MERKLRSNQAENPFLLPSVSAERPSGGSSPAWTCTGGSMAGNMTSLCTKWREIQCALGWAVADSHSYYLSATLKGLHWCSMTQPVAWLLEARGARAAHWVTKDTRGNSPHGCERAQSVATSTHAAAERSGAGFGQATSVQEQSYVWGRGQDRSTVQTQRASWAEAGRQEDNRKTMGQQDPFSLTHGNCSRAPSTLFNCRWQFSPPVRRTYLCIFLSETFPQNFMN